MHHCVGNYADRCLDGETRIVSIRRLDEKGRMERLSTAEIRIFGRVQLAQHRGHDNARPDAESAGFIREYLTRLEANPALVDREALRAVQREKGCGYDPHKPGAWERARDAWSPFLPRPIRSWMPEDFAAVERPDWKDAFIAIKERIEEASAPASPGI